MIRVQSKVTSAITLLNSDAVLNTCLRTNMFYLKNRQLSSTNQPESDTEAIKRGIPYSEREGRWQSSFALFANRFSTPPDISRLNPKYFTVKGFKHWINKKLRQKLCFEQRYLIERHKVLGNDLAAAHFLVFRGGAVKFAGSSDWIKDDKSKNVEYDDHLPNHFVPSLFVEGLDFGKFPIVYEGLENILGLLKLNWLSFQGSPHFDDWCLDRIVGDYHDKLEYLDISDTRVTYKGLGVLYKCSKLKTLKVNGIADSNLFQLTCLMLEDILVDLKIEGVEYLQIQENT